MGKAGYLSEQEAIDYFYDTVIHDKNSLLNAISETKTKLVVRSNRLDESLRELFDRFYDRVLKKDLPHQSDFFWGYMFSIDELGIHLYLCKFDLQYEVLDQIENGMAVLDPYFIPETMYLLFEERCKMLTAEEYGNKSGVGKGTVRQWIRRGKLRSAVKYGNTWRIPELSIVEGRGYSEAAYTWDGTPFDSESEYSYLCKYNNALFTGKTNNEGKYTVFLGFSSEFETGYIDKQELSAKDREKLELFLLSSPFVRRDVDPIGEFFNIVKGGQEEC